MARAWRTQSVWGQVLWAKCASHRIFFIPLSTFTPHISSGDVSPFQQMVRKDVKEKKGNRAPQNFFFSLFTFYLIHRLICFVFFFFLPTCFLFILCSLLYYFFVLFDEAHSVRRKKKLILGFFFFFVKWK